MSARAVIGRQDELSRIGAALAGARDGTGRLVVVEGAAGIGKTTMLAAARDEARAAGLSVLTARGTQLETGWPLGVARQLFDPLLGMGGAEPEGAAAVAARALAGDADASASPFAVLHGLYWLTATLAGAQPLALIVDDAQWADEPSLRFLAYLAPRVEELHVAVVVAARPPAGEPGGDVLATLAEDAQAEQLRPAPLDEAAVGRLLEDVLDAPCAPALATAARRVTHGIPLLVRLLGGSLLEEGVAPDAAAVGEVLRAGARDAGRWALVRIARLGADADRLARAVAVLETASVRQAAQVAGLELGAAAAAADALVAAGLLRADRPLSFEHPLLGAGVHERLGAAERAAAHRRAADVLIADGEPPERVAQHLLGADPAADPDVVRRLRAGAAVALRQGAPESAVRQLERALDEPPPAADRGAVLHELGMAEAAAGRPSARERLAEAVAAGGPIEATLRLALLEARARRPEAAIERLERARRAEPEEADADRLATLAASIARIHPRTAQRHAELLRAARARGDDAGADASQLAVAAIIAAQANEPAPVVAALARRSVAKGVSAPATFSQAFISLVWAEDDAAAADALEAAAQRARETGDTDTLRSALSYRAWLAQRRGDLRAAEQDCRTALAVPEQELTTYRLIPAAVLVEVLVSRGDHGEAAAVAAAVAGADDSTQMATIMRMNAARLHSAQGHEDRALAELLRAGEDAVAMGAVSPCWMPWRSQAAFTLRTLGRHEEAAALAEEEVGLARAFGADRTLGVALRAAGVCTGGEAGVALLRDSAAALDRGGARLEHARAVADLGQALAPLDRDEARRHLREALDAAHRLGAAPLAGRAERALRATGAKPRRAELTGVAALTASERRVAELAASGLTNRQIGETLFITARTAEGHLTRAFAKLGVRSRADLAGALGAG